MASLSKSRKDSAEGRAKLVRDAKASAYTSLIRRELAIGRDPFALEKKVRDSNPAPGSENGAQAAPTPSVPDLKP